MGEHGAGIDISAIRTTGGLIESTDCLDDREELERRYGEHGYLFFRGAVPPEAAEAARLRMAQVLVEQGLLDSTAADAEWIGGDRPSLPDESPLYSGICGALFEAPGVVSRFEKLLGEPIAMVPNVLYRAYKPHNRPGPIHQDGPYNPGAEGYRSLWIALGDIDESVGGMVLAPGYHRNGSLHDPDTGKIPADAVPDDAWRRENYCPGDVVVIHGMLPHGGMPNRSGRIRYSIDTRVQSAANPTVMEGELTHVGMDAVTLTGNDGRGIELALDGDTLLRFGVNGTPMSRQQFIDLQPQGRRVMATRAGNLALMLRHASLG